MSDESVTCNEAPLRARNLTAEHVGLRIRTQTVFGAVIEDMLTSLLVEFVDEDGGQKSKEIRVTFSTTAPPPDRFGRAPWGGSFPLAPATPIEVIA